MTWITGAEILARPSWGLKAELVKAFKAGLRPYREADGAMLMARIERDGKVLDMGSRCFHCVHGSEERGYMATGCPRNDAGQNIDMIIQKIIKPGIEEMRGKVDKSLFRDGLPSNVFDFPGYSADAEFAQFVEDRVGPGNLRAMMIESRCRYQEPADQNEVCDRLKAAQFRLQDVQAYEQWSKAQAKEEAAHVQQSGVPELDPPESLPASPLEYNEQLKDRGLSDEAARAYMIRNAKGKWGRMTNFAAWAIATDQPLPAKNDQAEKDRLNSRYTDRVHNGLLGNLPKPNRTKKKQ